MQLLYNATTIHITMSTVSDILTATRENLSSGILTLSDTNWPVQLLKNARS